MLCRCDELGGGILSRGFSSPRAVIVGKTAVYNEPLTPDLPFLNAIDDTLPLKLSYPHVPLAGSYVYTLRPSMSTK
jgi:hypothetical protein